MTSTIPFTEKYRPNKLSEVVLNPLNRRLFENILHTHVFPNLMLYGPPGTGKTSTIMTLIQEYKTALGLGPGSVIHLNASDERGIDIIRNQIMPFVRSTPMFESPLKFVILDEVDYMTKTAQQALKYLLQISPHQVRFCLICNYLSKIEDTLQNELVCVRFNQLPRHEVTHFLRHICVQEDLSISDETLTAILDTYHTDVRSMINFLQAQIEWKTTSARFFTSNDLQEMKRIEADGKQVMNSWLDEKSRLYNISPDDMLERYEVHKMRQSFPTRPLNTTPSWEEIKDISTPPPPDRSCCTTQFPETFNTRYRPYFIGDFNMEDSHLYFLSTLIQHDEFNVLCVGNLNAGKTTFLNALIRYYYGLTPQDSFSEQQILIIHSLKEQGIHFLRNEMKTFCQSRCNLPYGKKKMIVVDDLDTLPMASQQIFCNFLDKYRNNVVFISVCSSLQKVSENLQSRLHLFTLPSPSSTYLENILNTIAKRESLVVDDVSKEWLLRECQGSPRKLVNSLEKLKMIHFPIGLDLCEETCASISWDPFEKYIDALRHQQQSTAIATLFDLYDQGYSVIDILDAMFRFVKVTDLLTEEEKYQWIPLLCHSIMVFHTEHEKCTELIRFTEKVAVLFG